MQNIYINVYGDRSNVERIAKMIDVENLNKEIEENWNSEDKKSTDSL